jgi:acetyl esterase/lipase
MAMMLVPIAARGDGQLYLDALYGYNRTTDIVFGTGNTNNGPMQLLLDVYQPTDIGLGAVQSNRPAIVIQDGGAWTSGDKQNGRVVTPAIFLAQRGFTVFVADSRQVHRPLALAHGTT